MSWVSFDVIGWQSCAFTSWNWSRGGSEEHVGFHVTTMCHWMCHTGWKWAEKRGCNVVPVVLLFIRRWHKLNQKSWRYEVSRGIKKPWQINHSQAGIPSPLLTDISFYGSFASEVWSQRQAWGPLGNACGIVKEELKSWECAWTQMLPGLSFTNAQLLFHLSVFIIYIQCNIFLPGWSHFIILHWGVFCMLHASPWRANLPPVCVGLCLTSVLPWNKSFNCQSFIFTSITLT